MADISKIKLPNNSEYNFKDSGAIRKNETGNTQQLRRPSYLQGANDVTIDSKINTLRANRLAFLPADQIIIEKTVDGGTTWTDAGISDTVKTQLFSEVRPAISIPLLNGKKSPLCGLRITITAMKYNVPDGTAETQKYNYWNSNYVKSTERYNQLKEMYFWVNVTAGYINVKVERATGANPNTWVSIFDNPNFNMTGFSGNDYISFTQGVFGGGTTQTGNYWNYRITFMTDDYIPRSPYDGYTQTIHEIRGYGDTWWTAGNEYAANDKIYTHDYLKNVTFPNKVTATGGFAGNVSGTASNVTGTVAIANGGTGAITAAGAANNLITSLPDWTEAPTDTTKLIRRDIAGASLFGQVTFLTVWNYIKSKIESLVLSTSTSSTSTTTAATSSAVKTAYDLANTANNKANEAYSLGTGALIYDQTYSVSNGIATFVPHVYQGGQEITTSYAKGCFVWKARLLNTSTSPVTISEVTLTTKDDRSCDVTLSAYGYGVTIKGEFTPPSS